MVVFEQVDLVPEWAQLMLGRVPDSSVEICIVDRIFLVGVEVIELGLDLLQLLWDQWIDSWDGVSTMEVWLLLLLMPMSMSHHVSHGSMVLPHAQIYDLPLLDSVEVPRIIDMVSLLQETPLPRILQRRIIDVWFDVVNHELYN